MRRSVRKSLLPVIAALTASGVLLTAGCGGDDDSDKTAAPAAWVDVVCTGLGSYVKAGVAAQPAATGTNEVKKSAYLGFIGAVLPAYQDAEAKLVDLGKPDIANGDQRQDDALRLFRGALTSLESQQGQLEALDVNAADFDVRFNEIGRPLSEMTQLLTAITSDPDLRTPIAESQPCKAVQQSLGTP